jgi:hypothetical protein
MAYYGSIRPRPDPDAERYVLPNGGAVDPDRIDHRDFLILDALHPRSPVHGRCVECRGRRAPDVQCARCGVMVHDRCYWRSVPAAEREFWDALTGEDCQTEPYMWLCRWCRS